VFIQVSDGFEVTIFRPVLNSPDLLKMALIRPDLSYQLNNDQHLKIGDNEFTANVFKMTSLPGTIA